MNKFFRSVVYILMGTVSHIASAQAACVSPAGEAGDQIYNSAHNVMQYCNGSDWIAMGSSAGGGGADGDTLGDLACGNGESIQYNGAAWACVPGKVSRSGDTMTGPLNGTSATFSSTVGVATPTAAGHAATKQYVDDAVAGAGGAPLTCSGGVNPQVYNGHCYTSFLNADAMPNNTTAKEARDHCKAWGGMTANLVIINDGPEQAFVTAQYASSQGWIGLTDDGRFGSAEGSPRWHDGSAVVYTNWAGAPNQHNNNDWVRLNADGTWRYEPQAYRNFICEAENDHASQLGSGMCSETIFNGVSTSPTVGCGSYVDHTYCLDGVLYTTNTLDGGVCPPAPTDADEADGDMMWLKALDPDVLEQMNYNKAKGKL